MKFKYLDAAEHYDGSQLVSLRNYLTHGLLGDSVVAWTGSCEVSTAHMVDGEDLLLNARIAGGNMLHFVIEKFGVSLFSAVSLQRLFAASARDHLLTLSPHTEMVRAMIREGDDLYCGERKLSISIATQSPINSLVHFAVNISNQGTPVKTLSLEDLSVEPRAFALALMQSFCNEVENMTEATQKVRWVK